MDVSPIRHPTGVNVRTVKNRIPSIVINITGREGLLCSSGIFRVRNRCRINICVHMDSKNHPVWNRAMNCSCPVVPANAAKPSPQTAGQNTKNKNTKVRMSKSELIGPKKHMKRPNVLPDHSSGCERVSSST